VILPYRSVIYARPSIAGRIKRCTVALRPVRPRPSLSRSPRLHLREIGRKATNFKFGGDWRLCPYKREQIWGQKVKGEQKLYLFSVGAYYLRESCIDLSNQDQANPLATHTYRWIHFTSGNA